MAAKPARTPSRHGHTAPGWSAFDGRTILLAGVVGVLVFAALVTVNRPSDKPKAAQISEPAVAQDLGLPEAEPIPAPVQRTALAPAPAPVLRTASISYTPTVAPALEAKSVAVEPVVEREAAREPLAEAKAGLQPAAPAAEAQVVAATITGCLSQDDGRFLLKNVSGDGAPKSRSWKSGFLRKRSQTVELIDQAGTKRLAPYVGQQIETTGVLEDREMRVKSLRVQGACD